MKRILSVLTLLLFALPVSAIRVTSLYTGKIPVSSQAENDRSKALPLSLANVIVKVSGSSAALQNTFIKSRLNTAPILLEEYGYSSSTSPAQPYFLEANFNPEGVNKLLTEAQIPIWSMNRPLVLAWIEKEEPGKVAEIIDSSSGSDIQTSIKTQAELRGLPLIFPVMDMTDLNQISAHDIVTMNIPLLQTSASRYESDAILIARVVKVATGYSTEAKLVLGEEQWNFKIAGTSAAAVLTSLVNEATDKLAERYAALVTKTVTSALILKITDVNQENDFTRVLNYFQRLPQVASVEIQQIEGSEVELKINLRGTRESLMKIVSVGKKLTPVSSGESSLIYQWNH